MHSSTRRSNTRVKALRVCVCLKISSKLKWISFIISNRLNQIFTVTCGGIYWSGLELPILWLDLLLIRCYSHKSPHLSCWPLHLLHSVWPAAGWMWRRIAWSDTSYKLVAPKACDSDGGPLITACRDQISAYFTFSLHPCSRSSLYSLSVIDHSTCDEKAKTQIWELLPSPKNRGEVWSIAQSLRPPSSSEGTLFTTSLHV